jgi:hypothetical protein
MQSSTPPGVAGDFRDGAEVSSPSRAVVTADSEIGLERLQRAPVIDRILSSPGGAQQLALIKATVAPGCTDAEVGHFLELCSAYGLDPFAREAWCAKGKPRNGYSPWGKQVSAMMLGAVERQSIRQATPLGGIMAEGEDLSIVDSTAVDIGAGEGTGEPPEWEGVDEERAARVDAS